MLKLAIRRLLFAKVSSFITILTLMITVIVFLLLSSSLKDYGDRLTVRTDNDLLIAGSQASGVDLIMKSLYFRKSKHPTFTYNHLEILSESAHAAPLFIHYSAQGLTVCSTSTEYFSLRSLKVAQGRMFTKLGDCVMGAEAAERLGLKVGDSIVTDPDNVFNPAGSVPLKLHIKGILKKTETPDDRAVFTSLKTGWTMHGLGHEHPEDEEKPGLKFGYLEITDEVMKTFHFHGNMADYPLTAILLKPKSAQSRAYLFGDAEASSSYTVINPKAGLSGFLDMLFHLDKLFLVILVMVLFVIILLNILVISLNMRLRQQEKKLFDKLGFEKAFFSRLVAAEWFILINIGLNGGFLLKTVLNPLFKEVFDAILKG